MNPAITEFAGKLRGLREAAGSPSFRHLARMTHYSASTLAEATAGHRLPTEAVVKAFVTACGQDPDPWVSEVNRIAAAARQAQPASTDAATSKQEPTAGAAAPPPARRWTPLAAAAAAGFLLGALALWLPASSRGHTVAAPVDSATAVVTAVAVPAPSASAGDGEDPAAAHCVSDARLVDKSPAMLGTTQIGALELIYSPHCGAGWARIFLYPGQPVMQGQVAVTATDGRSAAFEDPLVKQVSVYTDVIVPGAGGCLGATAKFYDRGHPPISVSIPCQALGPV